MELDRRSFVKCAGLAGGAALTAAGASAALADEAASMASDQPWTPESWTYETDVVVVGTGTIAAAALRAYEEGLDVLVLEKHPTWFGGTTALCGGGCSCPNSTLALEGGAPEIPRDVLKNYLLDVAEGQSSEELVDMLIDNYAPAINFLMSCGVEFSCSPYSEDTLPSFNIYRPFSELEEQYGSVPCTVFIGMHSSGARQGRAIAAFTKDAIDARGIPVLMGTAATKLIYAGNPALGDGEVIGVWATDHDGNEIAIKARYGVILGTGGFDHNQDMVKSYINMPVYATCAIETNTGDGHIMGMEVGADLRNMNEAYRKVFNMAAGPDVYTASDLSKATGDMFSEARNYIGMFYSNCGSILVNRHGQRFCNEAGSYDLQGRVFDTYDNGNLEWCNIPGFLVMDSTCKTSLGSGAPSLTQVMESGELPEWLHRFDTLEELADGMGIDKEGLLATVERWNGFCAEGADLDYSRGVAAWDRSTCGDAARVESGELKNPCLAPIAEAPFYCLEVYPGMMQTAGGLRVNGNAQVLNVRGQVIPRLYAGSSTAQSPTGRGYGFGGATVANGMILGYVAAGHVATLEPWE